MLEYHELPVGLFEALELESELFAVDGKGQICFTRAFAKRAKVSRQNRRVAGVKGIVHVDVWTDGDDAGFALVRDGVLHLARVEKASLADLEPMLGSLSFDTEGRGLHKLIDRGSVTENLASRFRPMPAPLAALVRRAKKKGR